VPWMMSMVSLLSEAYPITKREDETVGRTKKGPGGEFLRGPVTLVVLAQGQALSPALGSRH
jgi:hypothetical protein